MFAEEILSPLWSDNPAGIIEEILRIVIRIESHLKTTAIDEVDTHVVSRCKNSDFPRATESHSTRFYKRR